MRRLLIWFLVGAAVVGLCASAFEVLPSKELRDIPLALLIILTPLYFVILLFFHSAPISYVVAALVNGMLYSGLAWIVGKIPSDKKLIRTMIVVTPFLPVSILFAYSELFARW